MSSKIVIIGRRLCVVHADKARRARSACRESARATSREGHQPGNRRLNSYQGLWSQCSQISRATLTLDE